MSFDKTKPMIANDDKSLKNILGQKEPALICFYDGDDKTDKPLMDALKQVAKKSGDELLIIQANISNTPDFYAKYEQPELPAVVTLTKGFFGRKVKSTAGSVRPKDVRNHVEFLLNDTPLPEDQTPQEDEQLKSGKKIKAVFDDDFRAEVLKSKTPVLVDFWAPWCGPCQVIAPYIEEMSVKHKGKIKVVKVNTDATPVTVRRYQISSMPTFVMFDRGQEIGRFSGASPVGIKNLIDMVGE